MAFGPNGSYYTSADGANWALKQSGATSTARDFTQLRWHIITAGDAGSIVVIDLPQIVTQPVRQSVLPGTATSFSVQVIGEGPFTYKWSGPGVTGATAATLVLPNVTAANAGLYSVVVSNAYGGTMSDRVRLGVIPVATDATQAVLTSYAPGDMVTITNSLTYVGVSAAMSWQVVVPDGWSYVSSSGTVGEVRPQAGAMAVLGWLWINQPASPVSFSYVLQPPALSRANALLVGEASITDESGDVYEVLLKPDPLVVRSRLHTADTDGDGRINLLELTRLIELYNTRSGATRTGAYVSWFGTEDGFSAGLRDSSEVVGLYHTADSNFDGKLGLLELTRVVEFYNYRSGSARTWQYHYQPGTEDGFATGP